MKIYYNYSKTEMFLYCNSEENVQVQVRTAATVAAS